MLSGILSNLLNGILSSNGTSRGDVTTETQTPKDVFSGAPKTQSVLNALVSDPKTLQNFVEAFKGFTASKKTDNQSPPSQTTEVLAEPKKRGGYVKSANNPLIAAYLKGGTFVRHETITHDERPLKI